MFSFLQFMRIKGSNVSEQCGHYQRQVAAASEETSHYAEPVNP